MTSFALVCPPSVRVGARRVIPGLGMVLVGLVFCLPCFSQTQLGRIYGGITDQTGGVIAGATVTVVDVARGISRPLISDGAGEYNAPNLIPGTYTVRAENKGFRTIERQNIQVEVGGEVRVDLALPTGEQTQTITVTESLPMVNTTNATLGGTIEKNEIADLPINGRNFQNLWDFRPGMINLPGGGSVGHTTNGLEATSGIYMLEGQFAKAIYGGQNMIGGNNDIGESATIVNIDAIQELTIIDNPKAEYGWNAGAVSDVGIKSGTNNIHGDAFAYGRTSSLDARNPFSAIRAPLQLEQFGAVVGGPIKKDKLFYFGAYEGKRLNTPQTGLLTLPTTASLPATNCQFIAGNAGDCVNSFADAIADMNAGGFAPNALSERLAGCDPTKITASMKTGAAVAPFCNASNGVFGNSGSSPNTTPIIPNTSSSDNFIGKLDVHFNDHHSALVEWLRGSNNTLEHDTVQTYWRALNPIRAQIVQVSETWSPNSTWVNEGRYGWHMILQNIQVGECNQSLGQPNYATAFGFDSGSQIPCAFPGLTISGGFTQLGCACDPEPRLEHSQQFSDSVSYTRGKHLFKFGFEWRRTNVFAGAQTNDAGLLTFGGAGIAAFKNATPLEDFLGGDASSGTVLVGNPQRHITQYSYAGFMQDDWRFTRRLTLNLGLRYEYQTPVKEDNNQFGEFIPSLPTGLVQPGVTPGAPTSLYKNDWTRFYPRLGFAWDVTGKGKTVLRGGIGMYTAATVWQTFISNLQLNLDPTGASLIDANGNALLKPGNLAVAQLTINGSSGLNGGATPAIPWVDNTGAASPVAAFNTTATGLQCGNGLPIGGVGSKKNPPACVIGSFDPNLTTGYVTEWNLAVDHSFTNNLSLTVAYAGNHSTKLTYTSDLNQPTLGTKNTSIVAGQPPPEIQRRPYNSLVPYASKIQYFRNGNDSNYDGLQLALTQRVSYGLSFTAGYTFAHALSVLDTSNGGNPMDSALPHLDYGNSNFDARSHFNIHGSWTIPGIKSPGQMLQGWQVNSVFNLLTALPFNADDTTNDISGTGVLLDRWTLVGSPSSFDSILGGIAQVPCFGIPAIPAGGSTPVAIPQSSFSKATPCTTVAAGSGAIGTLGPVANMPTACLNAAKAEPTNPTVVAAGDPNATGLGALASFGCYMVNGSVIVPPAQGTYGNMARNELRAHHLRQWDFSVTKDWKFSEGRFGAQFRVEFFNILNITQYGSPKGNLAAPASFGQATTTGNSGNAINGSGGPRSVQLALKLTF